MASSVIPGHAVWRNGDRTGWGNGVLMSLAQDPWIHRYSAMRCVRDKMATRRASQNGPPRESDTRRSSTQLSSGTTSYPRPIPGKERLYLASEVRIFLSAAGETTNVTGETTGGTSVFDIAVLATLGRTPPPPRARRAARQASEGLGVRFKP
jgi:hypothetical protein